MFFSQDVLYRNLDIVKGDIRSPGSGGITRFDCLRINSWLPLDEEDSDAFLQS